MDEFGDILFGGSYDENMQAITYTKNIKKIELPQTVLKIGRCAFCVYNFCDLQEINIPNSVTSIGCDAFHDCTSLSEIIIPNSVTNIGGGAFIGCSGLTKIFIPKEVITIDGDIEEEGLFWLCSDDLQIYTDASEKNPGWDESWNGKNAYPVTQFYNVNYNTTLEEYNAL